MFISSASSISFQESFKNPGYTRNMKQLTEIDKLVLPDMKDYLSMNARRRLSEGLRMALVCAKECLAQFPVDSFGGIIVGTGIGSGSLTEKFLEKIYSAQGKLISPTPFILSTHNTFAGQISLLLEDHAYNITHTHNSVSFELALQDSWMRIREGVEHILVGGVDEEGGALFDMGMKLGARRFPFCSGASFFIMSAEANGIPQIEVRDVVANSFAENPVVLIEKFLAKNNYSSDHIDQVLYSSGRHELIHFLENAFGKERMLNFEAYSGSYFTNSALAMDMARDILLQHPDRNDNMLIVNHMLKGHLGLILLKSSSAS
jgi:3-oxoacyl-[acyl-carrier-protein] synthase II